MLVENVSGVKIPYGSLPHFLLLKCYRPLVIPLQLL